MIFVTVGFSHYPFDRMVSAVDTIFQELDMTGERIYFQTGYTKYHPRIGHLRSFIDFASMQRYIREADLVISHAGVGSILSCLMNKKKPIVQTRLKRFGEHVDDHQLQIALSLSERGLIHYPDSEMEMKDLVRNFRGGERAAFLSPDSMLEGNRLIGTLSGFIAER